MTHIAIFDNTNEFKWQEEISQLRCAKTWSAVVKQEDLIRVIEATRDDFMKRKDELIRKTQNEANDMGKLNEQLAQINSSIDALMQSSNEHRQRYDDQRTLFRELSDRLEEQLREVKRIESKKERVMRDIQKLEERVANNDNK